ncbi:putative thiol:disulfide interchange protein DsbC precursor [Herminiimonas arsenicoxydans]|uniref:Thiol:disulfide interchange protein n=1 Tax=Herminiimonas arsenicoxydans TaxID=204773 RepID=A4G1P2_HERAR|nr:putative thiol:disulfide interchange protein DsbC precursor [Herminiimonas arsenicoxydans]
MNIFKAAIAVVLGLTFTAAFAETAQEAAVRKAIEPRLGSDAKVASVTKTPYSGLFEVQVNGDIIYTDVKAQYLFVGRVVDTKTYQDYTKARLDELNQVAFSDLPLEAAMKQVKGNGKRVIAVFEDPNCGYCKQFRKTLEGINDITVYTFMYNILSPDSITKSRNVWCSANRNKAWDDWMLNGKAPASASDNCVTPHEKVLALGRSMKVTGTPTIIFTDGSRVPGAIDAKALEAKLLSLK